MSKKLNNLKKELDELKDSKEITMKGRNPNEMNLHLSKKKFNSIVEEE